MLPGIDSPEVQRRLAANLERSFDISLSPEDVVHLTTVRAVLQCVRLRRWERELAAHEKLDLVAPATKSEASAPLPALLRDRFVRHPAPPASAVHIPATAPSFALRKS